MGSTFRSPAALPAGKLKEEGEAPFFGVLTALIISILFVQTASRFVTVTA